MTKRRKKKRRLKKEFIIVLLFIILIISIVLGFVFMNNSKKLNKDKVIVDNYVSVVNNSILYDKHY